MSAASTCLRIALVATTFAAGAVFAAPPVATNLDGRPVNPLGSPGQATVLLFTAADCPISDRYAPEVRRLAARFAANGVRIWLVYANAGETPAAARAHATAFGYELPVALDSGASLADRAGAEVTPEAAVFDRRGRLLYRGRIDDRYVDFGIDRPAATTHDLADAVAAVVDGRAVARTVVPAVGCTIVRHRP